MPMQAMRAHGITDAAAQGALAERLAVLVAKDDAANLAAAFEALAVDANGNRTSITYDLTD
jgi:hypothetical protein